MKIGILTLHSNTNFGGGLQQIALFETLKGLGHEPQVLCVKQDTGLPVAKRISGILTSYSPMQLVQSVQEGIRRFLKPKKPFVPNTDLYTKTDNFNYANLNYTPKFPLSELPAYAAECDALVCGSDQVWTDVYSDVLPYFCDGIPGFTGRKIAYAACSAHNRVPTYNRNKIGSLLKAYDAISVRDTTTAELVRRYSSIKPVEVCDPTLLYDFQKFLKPSPISEPYIFAYVLGDKSAEWHRRNIERIKKETGVTKVVALTTELGGDYPWADQVITDALAVDWMNILRSSQFVYTNSFHAVLFSLKFHRQFLAYYGDLVRSSRLISLRDTFSLADRIVKNPAKVNLANSIDFAHTDAIIGQMRQKSMAFLKDSFK